MIVFDTDEQHMKIDIANFRTDLCSSSGDNGWRKGYQRGSRGGGEEDVGDEKEKKRKLAKERETE